MDIAFSAHYVSVMGYRIFGYAIAIFCVVLFIAVMAGAKVALESLSEWGGPDYTAGWVFAMCVICLGVFQRQWQDLSRLSHFWIPVAAAVIGAIFSGYWVITTNSLAWTILGMASGTLFFAVVLWIGHRFDTGSDH